MGIFFVDYSLFFQGRKLAFSTRIERNIGENVVLFLTIDSEPCLFRRSNFLSHTCWFPSPSQDPRGPLKLEHHHDASIKVTASQPGHNCEIVCQCFFPLNRLNLQNIVKIESQSEYEETVSANVRTANDDKVWNYLLLFCLIFSNHNDSMNIFNLFFSSWFTQKKTIMIEAEILTLEMSKNMFIQLK